MKTLTLLACLAVPAAACATELKDPATVAREWSQAVEQALAPAAPTSNLREQSDVLTITPLERIFSPEILPPLRAPRFRDLLDGAPRFMPPPRSPRPREPLYDAPNYRVPDVLPDNLPPGSKLWEYNGRKDWIIPLGPDYRLIPISPETGK